MPALRNITTRNLIPVVDFERIQQKISNLEAFDISYLVTYVGTCL